MAENTENLTPMQKLHYQMLRKHYTGTLDDAISALKSKIASEDRKDGEPMVIYYQDEDGQEVGAIFAVPSSDGTGEGYMFYNADQIDKRFEEDELVTAEALLDLDERISGITSQFSAFTENASDKIVITKPIMATIGAGAINATDIVRSGTTLTEFVEQLLTKEQDLDVTQPTVSLTTAKLNPNTIESGSDLTLNLQHSTTDGKFTGSTSKGYSPAVNIDANVSFTGLKYTLENTTTGDAKVINADGEQTWSNLADGVYNLQVEVTPSVVNASDVGGKKNNNEPSAQKTSGSTLVAKKTGIVTISHKTYWGTTTASTIEDFVFEGEGVNVSQEYSDWTKDVLLKDTLWKTDGKNVFVLTNKTLDYVRDAMLKQLYKYTGNAADDVWVAGSKEISIGGTEKEQYNLYIMPVKATDPMSLENITLK